MFRQDQNRYSEGLLLYVKEGIPCRILNKQTVFSGSEIGVMHFFRLNVNGLF